MGIVASIGSVLVMEEGLRARSIAGPYRASIRHIVDKSVVCGLLLWYDRSFDAASSDVPSKKPSMTLLWLAIAAEAWLNAVT